jgi:hypothetical protein
MNDAETKALVTATVIETLQRMGVRADWKRERPAKPRKARGPSVVPAAGAPPALVAFLATRGRVTMADVMPVLGLTPGKRNAAYAGIAMGAAGWHRIRRLPGKGTAWFYERRQPTPGSELRTGAEPAEALVPEPGGYPADL